MIERLRMQEVNQVILTMPEGGIIQGKSFKVGEPVMIINNPALSNLSFLSKPTQTTDDQGNISTSGITNSLDFVINEGTVLYALWSYIYGTNVEHGQETIVRGNETLYSDGNGFLTLSAKPELKPYNSHFYLYRVNGSEHTLVPAEEYEFCVSDHMREEDKVYYVQVNNAKEDEEFFVVYEYKVQPQMISKIKQIHNNIFCGLDVYMDAVDLQTDEHHTVYIHCDKVQVDTDMVLSINDISQASFTPIRIRSIPGGSDFNKDVATMVVI